MGNEKTKNENQISIHAARVGCDGASGLVPAPAQNISIHAARVGCDVAVWNGSAWVETISIHAARVGCDVERVEVSGKYYNFNPRSPSGLRPHKFSFSSKVNTFQSTQPEWAATVPEQK